jgi:hypothetical protein
VTWEENPRTISHPGNLVKKMFLKGTLSNDADNQLELDVTT